ncbi:glutathione S-transferase family protein [Marinovum algicola]|nr:glutathione S-transferase family protein [Marinovum algicola]
MNENSAVNFRAPIKPRHEEMKLYYSKLSSSMAVHLLLEEIGRPYTAVAMDLKAKDQFHPEFLSVNPKGRVPALVIERGAGKTVVLTEVPAILAYLAQVHEDQSIAPSEVLDFAVAQSFNMYLAATVHIAHAHRLRGARWSDSPDCQHSMAAKVADNMADCMAFIEQHYLKGPWVLGQNYSICDPYLFTVSQWLAGDGVDLNMFPAIRAHTEEMLKRPAVRRIVPLHGQPLGEQVM